MKIKIEGVIITMGSILLTAAGLKDVIDYFKGSTEDYWFQLVGLYFLIPGLFGLWIGIKMLSNSSQNNARPISKSSRIIFIVSASIVAVIFLSILFL